MDILNTTAILVTLSAIFMYINVKYIKLPNAIGLMLIALLMSLGLLVSGLLFPSLIPHYELLIQSIDFNKALMSGMLSFLLFAGALHINIDDLLEQKWIIIIMATLGVVGSTFLIGCLVYYILPMLGLEIPFIFALVFGALISPTDPIAVLGILKQVGAPKSLETKMAGESLFNDGVGVVVFSVILGIALGSGDVSFAHISLLFIEEAVGGALFGGLIGWVVYRLLKSVDHYEVEILLTLALVLGGYSLASYFHLSGPIAMVVAGLLIGNRGKAFAMSENTHTQLFSFWDLIDEFLNSVLFVLIGLEVLILTLTSQYIFAGLLAIPIVLLSRGVCVGISVNLMKSAHTFTPHVIKILTWGGLRGGISVALALSIPECESRDLIIVMTYIVVVFSILIQGLTVKPLIQNALKENV
jgi:CPA1 family monovalent cation:H+ antiporter